MSPRFCRDGSQLARWCQAQVRDLGRLRRRTKRRLDKMPMDLTRGHLVNLWRRLAQAQDELRLASRSLR